MADALNTGISHGRGDFMGAGLNALALIPIVGQGVKALDKAADAARAADKAVDAAKGGRCTALSGRGAEDAVSEATGIPVNRGSGRQTVPGTGRGGFRIPDLKVFGECASLKVRGSIIEVKNVTRLSGTKQIRDLPQAAKNAGGHLEIFTNAKLPKTGKLADIIKRGEVVIRRLPE